jgi:hypothetical protein
VEATRCVEKNLPFEILGFDSDNGSEFLNRLVKQRSTSAILSIPVNFFSQFSFFHLCEYYHSFAKMLPSD